MCVFVVALLLMISKKWLHSSERRINCGICVTAEPLQAKTRVHAVAEWKLKPPLFREVKVLKTACLSSMIKKTLKKTHQRTRALFLFFLFTKAGCILRYKKKSNNLVN